MSEGLGVHASPAEYTSVAKTGAEPVLTLGMRWPASTIEVGTASLLTNVISSALSLPPGATLSTGPGEVGLPGVAQPSTEPTCR